MTVPQNILVFDTALSGLSVGAQNAEGQIAEQQIETAREQASLLIPVIIDVLKELDLTLKDVDLIGTTIGPGSFTGVRIGMTTAKSLALALDCPVVGLNTLDVMAHHYDGKEPLLCLLETKRQDFYARYYDADREPLTDPMAQPAEQILAVKPHDQCMIGGDCLERFVSEAGEQEGLQETITMIDTLAMIKIALQEFQTHGTSEKLEPLYLRDADTSEPKVKPRKLEGAVDL